MLLVVTLMVEELVVGVGELGVAVRVAGGIIDNERVGVALETRGEAVAGWDWGKREKQIKMKEKRPNETKVSIIMTLVGNWGF
jgi:hypothetical protein